jgi:hypothetical protein
VVDTDAFDDIPSDEPGTIIRPGDAVLHKRFGRGIVQSVDFSGAPSVVARFPGYGIRRVLAEYVTPG